MYNWRERRGHTVEGRRCGDVISGSKGLPVEGTEGRKCQWKEAKEGNASGRKQSGRNPGQGEREIERERGAHCRSYKENTSPKPFTGKMRGADFCEFLQPAGLKD